MLILFLAAAGWWHRYVEAAYARLAYRFAKVDSPYDVRYQPGQEERAKAVAGMMDDSVRTIEGVFDTKLDRPVVFCLRTENEYGTYLPLPEAAAVAPSWAKSVYHQKSKTTRQSCEAFLSTK